MYRFQSSVCVVMSRFMSVKKFTSLMNDWREKKKT